MMRKTQAGFSLVEVLVAVVILALGLLGFAGLQVTGLRYANNAALRFNVASQVSDIMDRIRANMVGFKANAYFGAGSGNVGDCRSSSCTSAQMAGVDLTEWNARNQRLLPSGSGTVAAGTAAGSATVTISWKERSSYDGGATAFTDKSYSLTFTP